MCTGLMYHTLLTIHMHCQQGVIHQTCTHNLMSHSEPLYLFQAGIVSHAPRDTLLQVCRLGTILPRQIHFWQM